jgi:N-acetylglucosamine kinase-like BadF-type ATPase
LESGHTGHTTTPTDGAILAIGVDGGGSKTEAWIARVGADGVTHVLGRGVGESSNPRALGFEAAMANLFAAVDAAWTDARTTPVEADRAVLAIAGAGQPEMRDRIAAQARRRQLATNVLVVHDALPVLAAGTPEGWGVALIVGTGSVAIGVERSGRRFVSGGWGYWFGDEGSGFWIGRQALNAVARAADGRGPETSLSATIAARLQIDEPRALLTALQQAGDVRSAMASLADLVIHEAMHGDGVASHIVGQAAEELAGMVAAAARGAELGKRFPLALAGGVICHSDLLRERLLASLNAASLCMELVAVVSHPVAGCLRLARRALD